MNTSKKESPLKKAQNVVEVTEFIGLNFVATNSAERKISTLYTKLNKFILEMRKLEDSKEQSATKGLSKPLDLEKALVIWNNGGLGDCLHIIENSGKIVDNFKLNEVEAIRLNVLEKQKALLKISRDVYFPLEPKDSELLDTALNTYSNRVIKAQVFEAKERINLANKFNEKQTVKNEYLGAKKETPKKETAKA